MPHLDMLADWRDAGARDAGEYCADRLAAAEALGACAVHRVCCAASEVRVAYRPDGAMRLPVAPLLPVAVPLEGGGRSAVSARAGELRIGPRLALRTAGT